MDIITYSLKKGQKESNEYYKDVKTFTDEVLIEAESMVGPLIQKFKSHLQEKTAEKIRTPEEYSFELLMLGTLYRIYGSRASRLDEKPQKIMALLADQRNKNKDMKSDIDHLRGILSTMFLLDGKEIFDFPELNITQLDKLLKYLEATGDFSQEVKRLRIWEKFFVTQNRLKVSEYLMDTLLFAEWFEERSEEMLGDYTPQVEKFLHEKHSEHLFKEDVIFCGRKRVEYHLNMVGAEIMNRSFRKDFESRPRKALLLPGCVRAKNAEDCRAQETNLGLKCTGCLKGCRVNQLTETGEKKGFEVYMISHESSAFSQSSENDRDELGIVGVACVSNLIAGGWKADSLGIPAQCVLLDYCGCKNHWDQKGFPTDINTEKLIETFEIDQSSPIESNLKKAPISIHC
jgi:Uncharacterized conserved protein